jgi:hypothetical protein
MGKVSTAVFAVAVLATLVALGEGAQQGKSQGASVLVRVTDASGEYIPQAFVTIHWEQMVVGSTPNPGIKTDITGRTGATGEFAAQLPEGFYDIFVASQGRIPFCRKVRARPGERTEVSVALVPDPQITFLLGHPLGSELLKP